MGAREGPFSPKTEAARKTAAGCPRVEVASSVPRIPRSPLSFSCGIQPSLLASWVLIKFSSKHLAPRNLQ